VKTVTLVLLMLGSMLWQLAATEVRLVATPPLHVAMTPEQSVSLIVAEVDLDLDESEEDLLTLVGGWAQAVVDPIFKTNSHGTYLNEHGGEASLPSQYVVIGYRLREVHVRLNDEEGRWSTYTLYTVPREEDGPALEPAPALVAGDIYWYEGGAARVVQLRNGTVFASSDDIQSFRLSDVWVSQYARFRGLGRRDGVRIVAPGGWAVADRPTFVRPIEEVNGALFAIATIEGVGYVWHERQVTVDGAPSSDPYFLDGETILRSGVLIGPDGPQWTFSRRSGTNHMAVGPIEESLPHSTVPEPYYTDFQGFLGRDEQPINLISAAEEVSTVGNQDTMALMIGLNEASEGTDEQKENADTLKEAVLDLEPFQRNPQGLPVPVASDTLADPAMEQARAGLAAPGFADALAVRQRHDLNTSEQVAPEMVEADESDTNAIRAAVEEVDAILYPQTPTSLPLRGKPIPRYAEMHPAGFRPFYLEGEAVPGAGDNPVRPIPTGVETGAPAYDLDGDGDIDRIYTSDPYDNGYDELRIKWDVSARLFRYRDAYDNRWRNNFAVFAQQAGNPEGADLLFVGSDSMLYMERQERWTGVTLHSFALNSLLWPTGRTNEFRFALTPRSGPAPPVTANEPLIPEIVTANWQDMIDVTDDDEVVAVVETMYTETVALYTELGPDPDLATEVFSKANFIPAATDGKPTCPAKYVRNTIPYTWNGVVAVPGPMTTEVVYFPSGWTETQIEQETTPPGWSRGTVFRWDYPMQGDGYSANYLRGSRFPRGYEIEINLPEVIARYGGQYPLQSSDDLVLSDGADFVLREVADDALELIPLNPNDPEDPAVAYNAEQTAQWIARRSDVHQPQDMVTDRQAGGMAEINHHSGERTFDIVEGAGFYVFKGQRREFTSRAEQMALLREMWDDALDQPKTIYKVLHIDNNPAKPLLNTAFANADGDAEELYHPLNGQVNNDLRAGAEQNTPNVARRNELKSTIWFAFSGAEGREWEAEWARKMPKNTKFKCIEWDDLDAVQMMLPHRDVEFLSSNEEERKWKGEVITKIFGRVHVVADMDGDGVTRAHVVGDQAVVDLAMQNPGQYVFLGADLRYGKPANYLEQVALLDDQQYGNPRNDQWVAWHQMEFRHPMVIFYDDRHSSLVVAYGENANPELWTEAWDSYTAPNEGFGVDPCRSQFEQWVTEDRAEGLYDSLHAEEFAEAILGQGTMAPAPTAVEQPEEPVEPASWSGGDLTEPEILEDPGQPPVLTATMPVVPWKGYNYGEDTSRTAGTRWLNEGMRVDFSRPGGTMCYHFHQYAVRLTDAQAAGHIVNRFPGAPISPVYRGSGFLGPSEGWGWSWKGSSAASSSGNFTGGQSNDHHLNIIEAVVINPGGNRGVEFGWGADDAGFLYVNGSAVYWNARYLRNGSFGGTLNHGWNVLTGYQSENSGISGWDFRINGRRWGDFANSSAMQALPYYRLGIGDVGARAAYDYYYRKVDEYTAAVEWQARAFAAWEDALAAYNTSVAKHNEWEERVDSYNAWLPDYQEDMTEYNSASATYSIEKKAYDDFMAARDAWLAENAEFLAAKAKWDAYQTARSNWAWLVATRSEEAGVSWEDPEPIFEAFGEWRKLYGEGPCAP
jgi:hypothetical protein